MYAARIVSINSADNTCVVQYVEYGNEEEHNLDDLQPPYQPYCPAGQSSDDDHVEVWK